MKTCNALAENIITKDGVKKWVDLLKQYVSKEKFPKEYDGLMKQFGEGITLNIPAPAAANTNEPAKNPCPTIDGVQWRSIPKEPNTKFCFGARDDASIKEKIYYILEAGKSPQSFPQYFFKKDGVLKCKADQVAALKLDGTGVECVPPGPDVPSFTYNYCPSGPLGDFEMIPRPGDGDQPKYCFGFLSWVSVDAMWPLFAPSSSYATLPQEQLGTDKQCNFPDGEVRTLKFDKARNDFSIDCKRKDEAAYPLTSRQSVLYPLLHFASATDTPYDSQGTVATACAQGKYANPFGTLKAAICRIFTGATPTGMSSYVGYQGWGMH